MKGKKLVRFTFHKRTQPADDFEPSDEVTTEVCHPFCSIEWKSGSESESGDQQRGREACTISLRWGVSVAGIDSTWWATRENQLTGETERFNFLSVVDVGDRHKEVVIEAVRA